MITGRHLVDAHMAGHAHALLGLTALTSPRRARRDRARRAMLTFRAVRRGLAAKVMALHNAGVALTLAHANHVDVLHFVEQVDRNGVAQLFVGWIFEGNLSEVALGTGSGLGAMTDRGKVAVLGFAIIKAD